ncbi:Subtilisin-like protease SBT1.6 [Camellia lanceoleosa]|uniref:Subtilisin-like protease SBT1.6 n=1 Tax=Camellia lanceoleosa TaxID=1840588 RepID=A0ACC0IHY2_9ERIC|nr:Subtilisin-like protease SBT1.6 [Camellia lanceoleosa]
MAVEEDTPDTQLHMTRMPSFLSLATSYGLSPNAGYGDGIIIGNFSTDDCNNKIIGARFFASGIEALIGRQVDGDGEYRSPRDATGHGSVVASIAVGAEISSVGVLAPKARIAVYKVCWWQICTLTDTLAAIDAAIFDGVDILSVSMKNNSPKPFYNDVYTISTLKTAQKDIFVTFGAGNMGLTPSTIVNSASWVTTVGSSTIDRTYLAKVRLRNGEQVPHNSLYCGKSVTDDAFPLQFYNTCTYDNIPSDSIKGKILI